MAYQKNIISESLELPTGRSAMSMPYSHYRNLAKKYGYAKVARSLGQLAAWNTNKNPQLAEFARDMQKKLKADFGRTESSVLNELGWFGKKKPKEDPTAESDPSTESDESKAEAEKERQDKIVNECTRIISRELGLNLKPMENSYQAQDPDMSNFSTYELQGAKATNESIFKAVQDRELNWMYSKRGQSIVVNVVDQKIQLILPATEQKIAGTAFNPTKEDPKGFKPITSLPKMVKDRQIKFDDGKLIPYDSNDTIIVDDKGNFWVGPDEVIDKGHTEYVFKNSPKPKVVIRLKQT